MPQVKPDIETFAKIKVVGVGGSGGSAVDRMVRSGIRGVEFIVMNTDVQALHHNTAPHKLHIGKTVTRGLGAGMNPEVGKRGAEESQNEIREMLKDADMVFITCGLGGGTGSGASPIIAEIARDIGALTVAVVTKPFEFEGPQRERIAEQAHRDLARHVDTIITIPNDKIFAIIEKNTPIMEAFQKIDEVLQQGVKGISELITVPGLINVDFADVKAIMQGTGSALMGIGHASGESRAIDAANAAVSSPLLDLSIDGARGILFMISGGKDLGMQEVSEAARIITASADDDVKVIFGAVIDESLGDQLRITVIATGFEDDEPRSIESVLGSSSSEDSNSRTSSFGRKPLYSAASSFKRSTPPPAPASVSRQKEEEDDEDEEETKPAPPRTDFVKKPTPNVQRIMPAISSMRGTPPKVNPMTDSNSNDDDEDEDLEIPAFIRKKMGM